jgi:hypothetical protein
VGDADPEDGAGGFAFDPMQMMRGMFGIGGDDGGGGESAGGGSKQGRGRRAVASKVSDARVHVGRLLTIADALVVKTIDPGRTLPAEFSPALADDERDLIEEPLAEIIAESKQLAKIAGISSMLSLSAGASMWAWRVYAAWRYKKMERELYNLQVAGMVSPAVPATTFAADPDKDKPHGYFVPEAPEMAGAGVHSNGMSDDSGIGTEPAA